MLGCRRNAKTSRRGRAFSLAQPSAHLYSPSQTDARFTEQFISSLSFSGHVDAVSQRASLTQQIPETREAYVSTSVPTKRSEAIVVPD
jgi:hypothetical protein